VPARDHYTHSASLRTAITLPASTSFRLTPQIAIEIQPP
jgi:hypothetical protein